MATGPQDCDALPVQTPCEAFARKRHLQHNEGASKGLGTAIVCSGPGCALDPSPAIAEGHKGGAIRAGLCHCGLSCLRLCWRLSGMTSPQQAVGRFLHQQDLHKSLIRGDGEKVCWLVLPIHRTWWEARLWAVCGSGGCVCGGGAGGAGGVGWGAVLWVSAECSQLQHHCPRAPGPPCGTRGLTFKSFSHREIVEGVPH